MARTTGLPHKAITLLRQALAGWHVVVVGSAPLAAKIAARSDEVLLPVNGGISSTSGPVAAWQVNSRSSQFEQWGPSRRRLAHLMLQQGAGRSVPLAILLAREPDAPTVTLNILAKQGTHVGAWASMLQDERRLLECDAGARITPDGHDAMSAGVTAASFALLAGAATVRLVGFSWAPGYEYLPGERIDSRGHVAADQRGLILLEHRYGEALEHGLPIPDETRRKYMAKTPKPEDPKIDRAAASAKAPSSGQRQVQFRVQAKRDLFFRNRRVRAGEVFTITDEKEFRPSQMEKVLNETPQDPANFRAQPFPFPEAARVRRGIPGMPRNAEGGLPTVTQMAGEAARVTEPDDEIDPTAEPAGPLA